MLKKDMAAQLLANAHVISQLRADNARLMAENAVLRKDVNVAQRYRCHTNDKGELYVKRSEYASNADAHIAATKLALEQRRSVRVI